MSFRLTFVEGRSVKAASLRGVSPSGLLQPNQLLSVPSRTEFRDDQGQVLRLAAGAEIQLIDSPYGIRPEYFGEVGVLKKGGCGKYRTSCWVNVHLPAERPDFLVRPSNQPNHDEFLVFSGNLLISEFDDDQRPFEIAYVREGDRLVLEHSPAKPISSRYNVVSVSPITDADYDYFLANYLDPRKWR